GGKFEFDESLEDIHMVVEAELIKRIGEPGKKLHTGRSRNDQVALDLALWMDEVQYILRDQLGHLQAAFVSLAERSANVVMPSFTHVQRAQPISAGAEALAWCAMFDSHGTRLHQECHTDFITSPLGSGAIAGSSLPLDTAATAKHLGFHDWQNVDIIT